MSETAVRGENMSDVRTEIRAGDRVRLNQTVHIDHGAFYAVGCELTVTAVERLREHPEGGMATVGIGLKIPIHWVDLLYYALDIVDPDPDWCFWYEFSGQAVSDMSRAKRVTLSEWLNGKDNPRTAYRLIPVADAELSAMRIACPQRLGEILKNNI